MQPLSPEDTAAPEREKTNWTEIWLQMGIPGALLKASVDQFDYALQLNTGLVLNFRSVALPKDPLHYRGWVHLEEVEGHNAPPLTRYAWCSEPPTPFNFERGLDVRVANIVWVADAPWGS